MEIAAVLQFFFLLQTNGPFTVELLDFSMNSNTRVRFNTETDTNTARRDGNGASIWKEYAFR